MQDMLSQRSFVLTTLAGNINNLHVLRWIVCFYVRVNGLLHHSMAQLRSSQLAPNGRLITLLGKLICTIQVVDVVNQDLQKEAKHQSNVQQLSVKISEILQKSENSWYSDRLPRCLLKLALHIGGVIRWENNKNIPDSILIHFRMHPLSSIHF